MKKILISLFIFVLLLLPTEIKVDAAYNYSPTMEAIASAEALITKKVVDTSNIKDVNDDSIAIAFGELVDVFGFDGKIFVVDNSNSKIYVLNDTYQFVASFGDLEGSAKLNKPRGIYVTGQYIYIADTGNYRVAIFNHDYEFVREITTPDDPTFKQSPEDPNGYNFMPIKVTVDRTGRVYVIADQIFEGIVDFNPDGTFSRYVGANRVTLSAWESFWLLFTTEEQRKAQGYRLATTFVNLNIDSEGYLYTVSAITEGEKVIKKLNYKGKDVLTRNGYGPIVGDLWSTEGVSGLPDGGSEFIDITINEEYGIYAVLDKAKGRIFTYDFEGNLLYIGGQIGVGSGTSGNQKSLFTSPSALAYYNNNILVVDRINKNLVVLEYTHFANLVNEATRLNLAGEYEAATVVWEEVLTFNTNYFLAYSGIGKAELREGKYEAAMENLKLGFDRYNYSKAYKQYRYDKLSIYMPYILGTGLAAIVYLLYRTVRKSIKNEQEEEKNA